MTKPALFIGLMSGTSTDGVDAVLCRIDAPDQIKGIAHYAMPFPQELRAEILALNSPTYNELHRAALVANQLAEHYAYCCQQLLQQSGHQATEITAIGAHGQTIRHAPEQRYTIQLNAPALLAELSDIDVIADFRSRDIAAGGQGAPLVPIFHQSLFAASHPRVILNLGGIANISILRPDEPPIGFDTGPANALLDDWIALHKQQRYDHNGDWARQGQIHQPLLTQLLSEPWLHQAPPKSTGRDLFNLSWLQKHLTNFSTLSAVDIQATLTAFTARSVSTAILNFAADCNDIIVCGGGAYNTYLQQLIAEYSQKNIALSDALGIEAQHVEATAFAWFAYAYCNSIAAGQPAITGAQRPTVLGAKYKA